MAGSDIVWAAVDDTGKVTVKDTYATAQIQPTEDKQQDWTAVSGSISNGVVSVELKRLLVTGDIDDRPLGQQFKLDNANRGTRVVAAWGASKNFGYHDNKRWGGVLELLDPTKSTDLLAGLKSDPDVFTVDLKPSGSKQRFSWDTGSTSFTVGTPFSIPEVATGNKGYFDMSFKISDLLAAQLSPAQQSGTTATDPMQIVGFEPLFDPTSTKDKPGKFLHHFVVYGHYDDATCNRGTQSMIWGWAPGVLGAPLPTTEAGFPVAHESAKLKPASSRSSSRRLSTCTGICAGCNACFVDAGCDAVTGKPKFDACKGCYEGPAGISCSSTCAPDSFACKDYTGAWPVADPKYDYGLCGSAHQCAGSISCYNEYCDKSTGEFYAPYATTCAGYASGGCGACYPTNACKDAGTKDRAKSTCVATEACESSSFKALADACYNQGCDATAKTFVSGFLEKETGNPNICMTVAALGCGQKCYAKSACAAVEPPPKAMRCITVNSHYDNPDGLTGQSDDSGVRLYIRKIPRKHDAGVLQLGDPNVALQFAQYGQQTIPGKKISEVQFECSATETSNLPKPVTLLASQLHMHANGVRMITEQIRNGKVLGGAESPRRIDYYDFNFQDQIDRKMTLMPGDTLRTTCQYWPKADAKFGLGSEEEMCVDFVPYFPAEPILSLTNGKCGGPETSGPGKQTVTLHTITEADLAKVRGQGDASRPWVATTATGGAGDTKSTLGMSSANSLNNLAGSATAATVALVVVVWAYHL